MDKKLWKEITIDNFEEKAEVYLVKELFYSVEYKGKEEYFTTDKEIAKLVSKMILYYFRHLQEASKIFRENETENQKWVALAYRMSQESRRSSEDMEICLNVYKSLEQNYGDKGEDKKSLPIRNAIRSKDNLVKALTKIVGSKNLPEAMRNFEIYKGNRNAYIESNPSIGLDILS